MSDSRQGDGDLRPSPQPRAAWVNGPGRIAAVYVIVVTPGILAFAFAQRLFFKGLMEGVLKA
jgi:ABC-type glycerol-3-phosphate transport system permease component